MGNKSQVFSAFCGILQVALPDDFSKAINERFEIAKFAGFNSVPSEAKGKYSYVKLIDSYFSDTFPQDLLIQIISEAKKFDYEIQILLLNPFSDIAVLRSQSLRKNDNIMRINRGLCKIKMAIKRIRTIEESEEFKDSEYINTQLIQIEEAKSEFKTNLEIRFTDEYAELPIYIISQFAFKGHITKGVSAADNTWIVCLDDSTQPMDLYDTYNNSFDALWESGSKKPKKKENKVPIEGNTLNGKLNDIKDYKLYLKKILEKNEYKDVLLNLLNYFRNNDDKNYNNVTLISAQLNAIQDQKISGTIKSEEIELKLNRIRVDLVSMIDSIE